MSTQTTHHVSSTDTGLLLQFLGILSILFAIITIFDPQWWLLATLPLTLIGLTLLLLPRRPGFQKLIEALDPAYRRRLCVRDPIGGKGNRR
ncbi:uncharacterized protein RCC_00183 [Ramularia collo-cygni]|uniref:Uncharacterized protein n=1 Tax=Ramularia collo-cygni TaxID=112498 RepID=A0A2D3UYF2_9PEZI|nr:uncharacterized protein RCC_00183 [Ramularia collo-cygni]CZT14209.1 uncharacterized protein RCC_00183 [Ramularia collo-cygni]